MKTLYTFVAALCLSATVNAQDFVYGPTQTVHTELTTNSYADANMDVETQTPQDIQFEWDLISNDIPTEWTYSLCDYTSCYPGIPATGLMTAYTTAEANNGITGYFKITINAYETAGSATVKIYIYDTNDFNIGDTVTFTFNHELSLGIEDEAAKSFSVYPNPVIDVLNLNNSLDVQNIVVISNILGEQISTLNIAPNSNEKVDVSAFDAGVYFVTYLDHLGNQTTEKIIKK